MKTDFCGQPSYSSIANKKYVSIDNDSTLRNRFIIIRLSSVPSNLYLFIYFLFFILFFYFVHIRIVQRIDMHFMSMR